MTIHELAKVLDEQRQVLIIRLSNGCPIVEFNSIYDVALRFAYEEVINVDFNVECGNFEIYI